MIDSAELLKLKGRVLIAGRVAGLLTGEEPLEIPQEQYDMVVSALQGLDGDIRTILTELDVLRGMVTGNFDFLTGVPSHGCEETVPRTGQQAAETDSSGEQPEPAATSEAVGSGGPDGQDASRPKPKRNRRRSKKNTGDMDGKSKKPEVDSSTTD